MQILDFRFETVVRISIIIVSYNVRLFLEQCLYSVGKAVHFYTERCLQSAVDGRRTTEAVDAEILVFDNDSSDGTIEYLQPNFPSVIFLSNGKNNGFATANNLALQRASGNYVLFLNPDTLLPEEFFLVALDFMKKTQSVGAVGVQMVNGNGTYLRESKRGLPGVWASFCKLTGLTAAFPRSRFLAGYYLGQLDHRSNHEVEVLSGACMLISKLVLDKTGGFDERFFMYAEDIDLSYRILQAGFKNYYISEITIVHYKGESTIKDFRYVRLFYRAMMQFVQKHYTGLTGTVYATFLKLAIGFRSLFAFGRAVTQHRSRLVGGNNGQRIAYIGDENTISRIRSVARNRVFMNDPENAEVIVLCEGETFSFGQIIAEMKRKPGKNYKIVSRVNPEGLFKNEQN